MKLSKALEEHSGTVCYVGSGNNFFYIGTSSEESAKKIEIISRYYKDVLRKSLSDAIKTRERTSIENLLLIKLSKRYPECSEISDELEITKKSLEVLYKKISEIRKQVNSFSPLLDREVTEIYDRQFEPPLGKIIIVKGEENGFAWFKSEFDDEYQKIEAAVEGSEQEP